MQTSFCLFLCLAITGCGALPQREQTVGSCTQESDCGKSGQVCQANQCVACSAHSECASRICDTYGDLGGVGKCVPASNIIYVNSTDPDAASCKLATGSQSLPFCELAAALDQLKLKPGMILSLLASPTTYVIPAIDQTAGAVVLVGSGVHSAGQATTLSSAADQAFLQLDSNANVVLDGVGLTVDGIVATKGAKVTIRRSTISYMQSGATFDGSTVTLDRDMFVQNKLGLRFNSCTVSLTNTFITGNTADPSTNLIDFTGSSGVFQFNTVAYNSLGASGSLALSCASSPGLMVKNSIFLQKGGTQQIAAECPAIAASLIVGKSDPAAGQLQQDPTFEDPASFDLRLKPADSINLQYAFDKAVQVNPGSDKNTDHDFYGTPRPQGTGYDIGAFELAVH